jgi:hypothetical protein
MIHASAAEPVGVAPQRADEVANTTTPISTIIRCPTMSDSRPPSANSADRESRYPFTIHCTPVAESERSFWSSGTAMVTIV